MEVAVISAARWVVGKALAPVSDGLLEAWAVSKKLGPNVDALKRELLCTQATLDNAQDRDVHSSAFEELLLKLRQLAYDADDVLDELDYFRIQDTLDGTYHAANVHAGGCAHGLVLNARHTARSAISKLKISACWRDASRGDLDGQGDDAKQGCLSAVCSCGGQEISSTPPPPANQGDKEVDGGCMTKAASSARNAVHAIGKHFPCYSFHDDAHPSMLESSSNMPGSGRRFLCSVWTSKALQRNHVVQTPKLKFDRVEISRKMEDIVEQLKPLRVDVSSILNLVVPNRTTTMKRPETTPAIIEPKLFGRDSQMKSIADRITHGEYCDKELTVLAIVGPGGIGKTTFTQHLYEEVKSNFQVAIWICVSLNFNANRLAQEIVKKIPKVNGEKENWSEEEKIAQRLQSKRFLLVLDDMWKYHEDEWRKLLAPFRKAGTGGNMVIVTTRFPKVAKMVRAVDHINLERLRHEDIMRFFEACVFGDQQPWKDHDVLREVGGEIVARLKGFPLAAKTVGRLLRNNLTLGYWTEVLDSKEWELEKSDDDIMPALKLSYDYLPFHLQQCFSYCALFPEDHEFDSKELIHFWIGQNILRSGGQNKSIEDMGLSNLNELVTHGFFKKDETHGRPCYLIHDLLHDLSLKVASHECVSVARSNVRSVQIRPSVRHLSIIMDDADDNDGITDENFRMELRKLKKRLKVENLQTLMIFGELDESFASIFGDLFREANALRVLSLPEMYSYPVESMLHNFSEFIHLRYLRLTNWLGGPVHLPSTLSRFYHLRILDLQNWEFHTQDHHDLPRGMSNLVKLRHFLTADYEDGLHSAISNVGKVQFLQELRKFEVNKENNGFELKQLGHLMELTELGIYNLEKIHTQEEAAEAKLADKNHLLKLKLVWEYHSNVEPDSEALVLESLRPKKNLEELRIEGHEGPSCPSWLGDMLSVKALKSLHLVGVAWKSLPPLGQMRVLEELKLEGIATLNEFGPSQFGLITEQSFHYLKRLELIHLYRLEKWVVGDACYLFSGLRVLIIRYCPELSELPFMNNKHDKNVHWPPNLLRFEIKNCPKVSTLPPVPWIPTLRSVMIRNSLCQLDYSKSSSKVKMEIEGTDNLRSLDEVVSFNSLTELRQLKVSRCTLEGKHLRVLTSLEELQVGDGSTNNDHANVFVPLGSLGDGEWQLPVERLRIWRCSGKDLTQLLSHLPKLSELSILRCEKITRMGVETEQQQRTGPVSWPSSSAVKMEDPRATDQQQQIAEGVEEEEQDEEDGLLLFPAHLSNSLRLLHIYYCGELNLVASPPLLPNGHMAGGIQALRSLQRLIISNCSKLLSAYSSSSSCCPFPSSLQQLDIFGELEGKETLEPFSNLMSLSRLNIHNDGVDLKEEGKEWPLLTLWGLQDEDQEQQLPKLSELSTYDVAGVLVAPFCCLLSSSLTKLEFDSSKEVERFTKEQEEALHLLTSLQVLVFDQCDKLQCLPAGLHRLTSLKRLMIFECPAIRSLPEGDLPKSLQELNVSICGNDELKQCCRKSFPKITRY